MLAVLQIKSALQKLKELRVTVIPWRQLTLGPRLGSGGFGEVFRGEWRVRDSTTTQWLLGTYPHMCVCVWYAVDACRYQAAVPTANSRYQRRYA